MKQSSKILKLSRINLAYSLCRDLETLDKEVVELEKIGLLVANGNASSSFTLTVIDNSPKKETNILDEDGSLKHDVVGETTRFFTLELLANTMRNRLTGVSTEAKKDEKKISQQLDEKSTLNLLGLLLLEKNQQRNKIIDKLKSLGYEL